LAWIGRSRNCQQSPPLSIDGAIVTTMDPSMGTLARPRDAPGMTWHARLKEKVGSNRKAAARLFPEWKKKARKEVEREKTTAQALENRIGLLNRKGDATGWWRDRPVLKQLLADLLELEPDEIFGAPTRTLVSTFREFPALPPLERDDVPCRTSRAGSVFELACAAVSDSERRRHWIVVPPGGGKSLAIELLRARFPGEVTAQTVVRLGDAVAFARNDAARPVVVEVEESDAGNDLASVSALEMHRGSVVVLAPFKHPDERITEWRTSLPEATPRGWNGTWATSHAVPDAGWIARMLAWVEARLSSSPRDTKFDKDELLAWLDQLPAVLRAIQSPGDLLALCADFDSYGSDGAPQDRAERWLRSFGVKALPEDAPRSWATYGAADCVTAMVVAHALDRATVLQERSFTAWSALVPSGPPASESDPGPELVVGFLRAGGLLRADDRGVTLSPNWVGESLAQRRLAQLVKDRDVHVWGAIAGDASRQFLVDDALDALAPSELRAAGEALLAHMANGDSGFAEVAGLEAMVAALARRLVSVEHDRRDAALARRALAQQLDHLVSGATIGERRAPTTRRNHDEWFLSGWAISLATSGAEVDVPKGLRWELPGWSANLRLSEAQQLNHFPWSTTSPWGASSAVRALMELTPRAVARLTPSEVPKDVPRLLLPALILADGWELTHEHLGQLAGTWEETVLADAVQRLDDGRRKSLAEVLWRFASDAVGGGVANSTAGIVMSSGMSIVAGRTGATASRVTNPAPVAERIIYLQSRHAPLLPFVLANLPAAVVEETARIAGTHRRLSSGNQYTPSDPRALRYLNYEQRAAAVRGRLSNQVRFDEVRELVEVLDGDDLDVLLDVVRAADRNVAAEFASRVWRILPERAEAEARRTFGEGLPAAEAWFRTAPRARTGVLIGMVEGAGARPPWIRDWALAKLLDAGVYSEALYRLMRPDPPLPPTKPSKKRAR
jgi:hypothetical protein